MQFAVAVAVGHYRRMVVVVVGGSSSRRRRPSGRPVGVEAEQRNRGFSRSGEILLVAVTVTVTVEFHFAVSFTFFTLLTLALALVVLFLLLQVRRYEPIGRHFFVPIGRSDDDAVGASHFALAGSSQ